MTFGRPWLLVLALLLPLAVAAGMALSARRRRRAAEAFGERRLVTRMTGRDPHAWPRWRAALLLPAAAALGVAAADPRWGQGREEGAEGEAEVALVLDASNSMLAEDVRPSRLERERAAARALVRGLPGSRIGVVAFSGRGYVLSPLTSDAGALELYLDALSPGIVTQGGSSLAASIRQGVALLGDSVRGGRALVLMTDGEALEEREDVLEAAREAGRRGVAVHAVGIGTAAGARVPDVDPVTGARRGFKVEPDGSEAVSRLDEPLLRELARESGGAYYALSDPGAPDRLRRALAPRAGAGRAAGAGAPPGYEWLLGLALLLLVLDTALAGREGARGVPLLAAALLLAGCGDAGTRHYRRGEYAQAAEAYGRELARGGDSARVRYGLGTSLHRLGRHDEARAHLDAAAASADRAVPPRAFYNSGNTDLEPVFRGAPPDPARRARLERAVGAYRRALLLRPDDADAKWNLELALRLLERKPPPPPTGGGGGGGGGGGEAEEDPEPAPGGLTRAQAERILQGAEEEERQVQRDKLRKAQPRPRTVRDW